MYAEMVHLMCVCVCVCVCMHVYMPVGGQAAAHMNHDMMHAHSIAALYTSW